MNNNFQIFQYDGSQYNQLIPNSSNIAVNSTQLGGIKSNLYATKEYVDKAAPSTPYSSPYDGWTKIDTITLTQPGVKDFQNVPENINFVKFLIDSKSDSTLAYWGINTNSETSIDIGSAQAEDYVVSQVFKSSGAIYALGNQRYFRGSGALANYMAKVYINRVILSSGGPITVSLYYK